MGKYSKAKTPKRHRIWCNDRSVVDDIVQEAGYMSRLEMQQCKAAPLVHKYIDSNGIKRHTGVRKNLKQSQRLVCKTEPPNNVR